MNTKCWARFRYKQRLQFHPIRIFCLIWIHHFIRNEETQTRTTRAPIIWDVILHSGRAAEQAMLSYIYSQSPMAIAHRQKNKKQNNTKNTNASNTVACITCLEPSTRSPHLLQRFFVSRKLSHNAYGFCSIFYFVLLCIFLLFSFHKHGATTNGITDKE